MILRVTGQKNHLNDPTKGPCHAATASVVDHLAMVGALQIGQIAFQTSRLPRGAEPVFNSGRNSLRQRGSSESAGTFVCAAMQRRKRT